MPALFAAIESRINLAVVRRLSNSLATLNGVDVQGVFENQYLMQDDMGTASATPVFQLLSADVPAAPANLPMVIGGLAYKIVEPMHDGTGMTVLRLRKA